VAILKRSFRNNKSDKKLSIRTNSTANEEEEEKK
jgi:hypothetical protein